METGGWEPIKQLRKAAKPKQGRLKDMSGVFVSSEDRADTLANHLEKVQWAVLPCTDVINKSPIAPQLQVDCNEITKAEVKVVLVKLKNGKAGGADDIVPEYFKSSGESDEGQEVIYELLNL